MSHFCAALGAVTSTLVTSSGTDEPRNSQIASPATIISARITEASIVRARRCLGGAPPPRSPAAGSSVCCWSRPARQIWAAVVSTGTPGPNRMITSSVGGSPALGSFSSVTMSPSSGMTGVRADCPTWVGMSRSARRRRISTSLSRVTNPGGS